MSPNDRPHLRPTWPKEGIPSRPVRDFVVIDAGRAGGRIYRRKGPQGDWFWGASLDVVREATRDCGPKLDEAVEAPVINRVARYW
jgi:hypothetical protein